MSNKRAEYLNSTCDDSWRSFFISGVGSMDLDYTKQLDYCNDIMSKLEEMNYDFDLRDIELLGMWEQSKIADAETKRRLRNYILIVVGHNFYMSERETLFFELASKIGSDVSIEFLLENKELIY